MSRKWTKKQRKEASKRMSSHWDEIRKKGIPRQFYDRRSHAQRAEDYKKQFQPEEDLPREEEIYPGFDQYPEPK